MPLARDQRRHRRTDASAAGFTLLEVMLAVTILGIVATTLYGTFARTLRSKTLAEDRIDVVRTGRTAVNRIADEIMTAVYPSSSVEEYRFLGTSGDADSVALDSIAFASFSNGGGSEARATDQRVIEYFFPTDVARKRRNRRQDDVGRRADTAALGEIGPRSSDRERDDEAFDLFAGFGSGALRERGIPAERLLRREAPLIQPGALADAYATVFLDNIASLRFRFCNGTEWMNQWDSNDPSSTGGLPRAVAIDLGLYDADGVVHHFATAVDLPMSKARVGAGCPPWESNDAPERRR